MPNYNYRELLEMDPLDLFDWLNENFSMDVPDQIVTIEDMEMASELLLHLTANQSYLSELYAYADIMARKAKSLKNDDKTKESVRLWEDMVGRKQAIKVKLDSTKQQYQGVSRSITVKSEINRELQMQSAY